MFYFYQDWHEVSVDEDEPIFYVLKIDEVAFQILNPIVERTEALAKELSFIQEVVVDTGKLDIIFYEIPGDPKAIEIAKQAMLDSKVEFSEDFPLECGYPSTENPFQDWLDNNMYEIHCFESHPEKLIVQPNRFLRFKAWPWSNIEMDLDWDAAVKFREIEDEQKA